MATRTRDWRTALLARGFGLGPLLYDEQVEQHIQRIIPFSRFAKEIDQQLKPFDIQLQKRTLEWLYTIGIRARAERDVVQFAKRIVQKKDWNVKTGRLQRLLTLLNHFSDYDLEAFLRNALGNQDAPRLKARAVALERDLHTLLRLCSSWRQFADWGTLGPDNKGRVVFIERRLEKCHSDVLKTKALRVAVIRSMLAAMDLKENADDDAISRMLRPSRLGKKRKPKPD